MPLYLWRLSAVRLRGCISAGSRIRKVLLLWIGAVFSDRPLSIYKGCLCKETHGTEEFMDSLKTIEGKVRAVLQENEDARNDDMVLYLDPVSYTHLRDHEN